MVNANTGDCARVSVYLQVTISPSWRLIVVCAPLTVWVPPLGLATEHTTLVSDQFVGIGVSVTVYVWKFVMFVNARVLSAGVPSSTRLKFDSGAGDAVKGNAVAPVGIACFWMMIAPGKITVSAESATSWAPPLPSRPPSAVWYGEPLMAAAELFTPH